MAPSADNFSHLANGSRPRILIPEKVSADGLALLSHSFEIDQRHGLSPEDILSIIPKYDALIVRSETRVTSSLLAAASKLKVVARAGVGVDNIDVEAATNHGIIVVNSPSGNIVAAAEHTIALLMATARNVPAGNLTLREGKWVRSKLVGVEVSTKTLGIIGLGKVGVKVARMAVGLGMEILAFDPYASPEIAASNQVTLIPTLDALLPQVDFLTIHTPLIASTLDLIGEKELASMKPTARILNVARGGVINEQALFNALENGTIAGAGIDVWTAEPPIPDSAATRLIQHPKVVATPHLGASTLEAQENVSIDVCAQVHAILQGGLPTSAVNAPIIMPEEYRKLQPFVKLVEKIGSLYTQHFISKKSGKATGSLIGGKKFDLIYEGELASISNTRPLFAALVKGLTSSISASGGRDVNIVNASLIAKERGIVINESHRREASGHPFSSLVTLRATDGKPQTISGYVSGNTIHISHLDRFSASFVPEGTLLICHNYDAPGKIGAVGSVLGTKGINIRFMTVAPLGEGAEREVGVEDDNTDRDGEDEALMILGVTGPVEQDVVVELENVEGILDVSAVVL